MRFASTRCLRAILPATLAIISPAIPAAAATLTFNVQNVGREAYTGGDITINDTLGPDGAVNVTIDNFYILGFAREASIAGSAFNFNGKQLINLYGGFNSPVPSPAAFPPFYQFAFFGDNLFDNGRINLDNLLANSAGGSVSYALFQPSIVLALPETGTWAMMVFGIGIAGAALRRRRSARVSFA